MPSKDRKPSEKLLEIKYFYGVRYSKCFKKPLRALEWASKSRSSVDGRLQIENLRNVFQVLGVPCIEITFLSIAGIRNPMESFNKKKETFHSSSEDKRCLSPLLKTNYLKRSNWT